MTLFPYQQVRHEAAALADVPAEERTDEQKARFQFLDAQVQTMKGLLPAAEALAKATDGKLVAVVLGDPGQPELITDLEVRLANTEMVAASAVRRTLSTEPDYYFAQLLKAMTAAAMIAR